jgi:hypothetical protein
MTLKSFSWRRPCALTFAPLLVVVLTTALHAQTYPVPEILYYKFDSGTTTTPNYAVPGRGASAATLVNMTMGPGGQFDSALVGNAGTGTTTHLNTGWTMDLGTSSWTIGMWINNFPGVTGTSYIFGNDISTSFRCFTNGAAGSGNITLRANSFSNVNVTGVLPGPSVVHFVYDSATTTVRTYVNGAFQSSVTQPALNLTASVVFKVGSYGSASSIPVGALVDEFRVYSRKLDSAEIAATWNHTLPYTATAVLPGDNTLPSLYTLGQNYPNPFNPSTTIVYSIPVDGQVDLKVYDMIGREVDVLVHQSQRAGNHRVTFDGSHLAAGVYVYRLMSGRFSATQRLILLK